MNERPDQKFTKRQKLLIAFWTLFVLAMMVLLGVKIYYLIEVWSK